MRGGGIRRSTSDIIDRKRHPRLSGVTAAALLALLFHGCAGDGSPVGVGAPKAPPVPTTVVAVSGNAQRATILAALPESLRVSVRDQYGHPVTGVLLEWLTDSSSGTLSPTQAVTDTTGRAATRWVFGATAGVKTTTARVAGLPPLTFTDTAMAAACPVPDDLSASFAALGRTIAKLRSGAGVTIVAIGSSSTEGVGASSPSASYPSRLASELAARYPGQPIRVLNKGVGGQTAAQMVDRFQSDVFALSPDLVIWQTGTIEAIGDGTVDPFLATLRAGTEQIRAHGVELLLMDSQFYAGGGESPHYRSFQAAMAVFARESGAPLVPRYALMSRYVGVGLYPLAQLLASDSFHPSDLTYRCLGEYIAGGLNAG